MLKHTPIGFFNFRRLIASEYCKGFLRDEAAKFRSAAFRSTRSFGG